ncbi:hypothetical protein GCM10010992_01270 [Cloacibacterium rupense]|uniref:SusE outer membrane protein domain-containing protein n=1 Tax=Cloacibacterium rupense TaxID=517423 RepID=A0ABQ2NFP0_9FLAO|nr:SusE domain-containing protein [Cloacibacterium rupense]GGP01307.1 hypothetical protein GCM10010992_01270 [Cloacibacterium rupense]
MKNIFKILFTAILGLTLASCERDDVLAVADLKAKPEITSSLSATSYVINETNLLNTFETIIFKKANYGVAVETESQLELAVAATSFAKPINLGLATSDNYVKLTYTELNNALISLGLAPNTPVDVEVRVKSNIKSSSATKSYVYSNPISFKVSPFKANPDDLFPSLAVPGGYGGASGYADWNPDNAPRLYSAKKDDKYAGFVWMNVASPEFKFTYAKEGWGNNKGDTADPNTYTSLAKDGKNIKGAFPNSTYFIKVDWAGNTYSVAQANMGIIGEATPTGWNSDTKLTFNTTSKKFEIASIALTGGKIFKFRNNDSWSIKIQPKSSDVTLVSGKEVEVFNSAEGTVNGDPSFICPETGNYKIVLDLHNSGYYNMTITKL